MTIAVTMERRINKRRFSALQIIASTVLALALLWLGFFVLVQSNHLMAAQVAILIGNIIIVASAFYAWHWETAQRLIRVMRNTRNAEQARIEAEETLVEKSRMLATMSHEIRTPLNGVIGMMQLLLETPLTAEQKNYAKTAHSSGRTLLSIIDEILDVAKAEALQGQLPELIDIQSLAETITELLAPRAHAKNIEISTHVSAELRNSDLKIPELKLRQILFNLAGNAIKFTHSGGVEISMVSEQQDLIVTVKDSGIGMSAEELSRVFNEFEQAKQNTSRHYGGTGLGLAITKRIVEELGGMLKPKSEPGRGTEFRLRIPSVVQARASTTVAFPLQGRKFVLAMNGNVNAKHLAKSLTELGGDVTEADTNSLNAYFAAPSSDRILISDTSQHKTLRRWAKAMKRKGVRVAQVWTMLTAEERQSHQDLLASPYAGYLLKPLRRSTLLNQLTAADDALIETAVSGLRDMARRTTFEKPLNILLAEDNPINLLLLRTMLQKSGHSVDHVGDGKAFLAKAAAGKFDIGILDVNMPIMNGFEAAKEMRANASSLPLIALTANATQADKLACYAAGFNGFVAKPFDQQDLIEAINKLTKVKAA